VAQWTYVMKLLNSNLKGYSFVCVVFETHLSVFEGMLDDNIDNKRPLLPQNNYIGS
jgi:hypothetical protein